MIDCNVASEAYRTLVDLFAGKNTAKVSQYLKELNSFEIDESKTIAENMVNLESIERGLLSSNGQDTIQINDLICLMLANSLPEKYYHLRYNIYDTLAVPNSEFRIHEESSKFLYRPLTPHYSLSPVVVFLHSKILITQIRQRQYRPGFLFYRSIVSSILT